MPRDAVISGATGARLQRATGRAAVTLVRRDGATCLQRLHQSGSAKAFLPRCDGTVPEVVFLNTAGGLTGGDSLAYALTLGPDARCVATTQTAERAYASAGGRAAMDVCLTLGSGAQLDWLPQETILFDRSTLSRRTSADLAAGAGLLLAECVVLGRAAMGETLVAPEFADWREVRRDGVPVLIEPLRLTGATLAAGRAAVQDARAVATLALIADGAEDALGPVRAVLSDSVEAAASAWDGKLLVRLLGADLLPVRRAMVAVLNVIRGRALPRVWQM